MKEFKIWATIIASLLSCSMFIIAGHFYIATKNAGSASIALISLVLMILFLYFSDLKEIKLFGLYAKFQEKVNEAENILRQLKIIAIDAYRHQIEFLINAETNGYLLVEESFSFSFESKERKIQAFIRSLDNLNLTSSEKEYILHPYYSFKLYIITEAFLAKFEVKSLDKMKMLWNVNGSNKFELARKKQVSEMKNKIKKIVQDSDFKNEFEKQWPLYEEKINSYLNKIPD